VDGACKIPIAAELMLPIDGARLSAIKSRGATLNGEPFTSKSPRKRLDESTVGLEIGNPDLWRVMLRAGLEWIPSIGNITAYSSAAYPIGQVCLGRLSGVVLCGRGCPDPLSVHLA
ncbi:uncharacterized protein METZ01_LOCUS234838, partial [marine metagenome]